MKRTWKDWLTIVGILLLVLLVTVVIPALAKMKGCVS